jgi:hypothetical protein
MKKLQTYSLKRFLPLCLLSLLCSSFLFTNSVFAADIAGRIIMAHGNVQAINDDGVIRQLKRRDSIFNHEVIKTGKESKVQIRFTDNALLALKADSELNIKAYVYSATNEEDNQVLMELVAGGFRTLTGKIGKGNKEAYKIDTPVASIGIRGTLYDVQLSADKILAGVWNGGISLNTLQGQFNLGLNSNFDFGEISSTGIFTGLLIPPQAFTPPTPQTKEDTNTEDSSNKDQTQEFSDNKSKGVKTNETLPLELSLATNSNIPSPFEKDEQPNESVKEDNNFTEDTTNADGTKKETEAETEPEPNSNTGSDSRLTNAEMDQLLTGNTLAFLNGNNNKNLAIALNTDGTGETFFIAPGLSEDGKPKYDTIRRGNAPEADFSNQQPWSDQVSWGMWQGSSETPIERYTEFNNNKEFTPLEKDLFYMLAQPASLEELNAGIVDGIMTFSTSSTDLRGSGKTDFIANSSLGNVMGVNAQFDLSASAGNFLISNVYLDVNIEGGNNWNMFSEGGEINGAVISVDNLTGQLTNVSSESSLTASGTLNGLLLAPNAESTDINTFAGSFDLSSDDGVNDATGVIILQTGQDLEQSFEPR